MNSSSNKTSAKTSSTIALTSDDKNVLKKLTNNSHFHLQLKGWYDMFPTPLPV